jgi:hypothetical protein
VREVKVVLKFTLEVDDTFDASKLQDVNRLIVHGMTAVLDKGEQAKVCPGAQLRLTTPRGVH